MQCSAIYHRVFRRCSPGKWRYMSRVPRESTSTQLRLLQDPLTLEVFLVDILTCCCLEKSLWYLGTASLSPKLRVGNPSAAHRGRVKVQLCNGLNYSAISQTVHRISVKIIYVMVSWCICNNLNRSGNT